MKKALFYLPVMVFGLLGMLFADATGGESILVTLCYLVPFWASGILMSRNKAWGSLLGGLPAVYFIYHGMKNWKLGQLEIWTGIVLLLYYFVCAIAVIWQRK